MSKKGKQYQLWMGIGLTLVVIAVALIAVAVINAMGGEATGDLKISGEAKVTGLICKDTTSIHPALMSKPAEEYTNTITANFQDDKLSSISLVYEGDYGTKSRAEEGEAFARADYNLTLTEKYGKSKDIFSFNFSVNGAKLQMTQATRDISKIDSNTVSYFLLDRGTNMAKTLDGLKKQYEAKGFSCEKSD